MHTIDRGLEENFFQWKGRLNRKRYLKRMLALWIPGSIICLAVLIAVTVIVLGRNMQVSHLSVHDLALLWNTLTGIMPLALLPFLISSYTLMIRRLHDLNLSGYFSLMNFVPLVNLGLTIYLFFAEGTRGANIYGTDPLTCDDGAGEEYAAAELIGEGTAAKEGSPAQTEETSASPKGLSLPPIFSRTGRLSRRDYALSIGVLFGSETIVSIIGFFLLVPLIYLFTNVFFRDTADFFWPFLFAGLLILLIPIFGILPLLSIPATIRRLHDIGYNGFFALPMILVSFFTGTCFLFLSIIFLLSLTETSSIPALVAENEGIALLLSAFGISFALLIIPSTAVCIFYTAWIFLKKGNAYPNDYGNVPAEQPLAAIRTEFFSAEGSIGRRAFILSALLLLFVMEIAVPTIVKLVIYPVISLLAAIDVLPAGANYLVLLLSSALYPLALLPLVIRRLRTLGRGAREAVCPFAIIIPAVLASIPFAGIPGLSEQAGEDAIDISILTPPFNMMSGHELAFVVCTCVCGIVSLIGVIRLLAKDAVAESSV
ncbi:DUF805 domain-containing protein [Selenomonas noxia]